MKYTFSILILLFIVPAFGQDKNTNELEVKPDFRPHELKVGLNLIRFGRNAFDSDLSTGEIQAALGMHSYFLTLDLGTEKNTRGDQYVSDGHYFRIGVDHNFVKDKYNGNVLSLGLRYARASFDESLNYSGNFGFGQNQPISRANTTQARWAELAFKLRGKVVSNLYMGMTMRWQVLRKINGETELKTYDIPGYGNTKRKNSTQFDYYVAWRLELGKGNKK